MSPVVRRKQSLNNDRTDVTKHSQITHTHTHRERPQGNLTKNKRNFKSIAVDKGREASSVLEITTACIVQALESKECNGY